MRKIGCLAAAGFGLLVMIGGACAPELPARSVAPATSPPLAPVITTFTPESTPTLTSTPEPTYVAPVDDDTPINIPNPDLPGHAPRIHVHVGRHHW